MLTQVVTRAIAVEPDSFVLTVTPDPVSVRSGATAALLVTVRPLSGFDNAVALSCPKLPYESSCTFETTVIPSGGGTTMLYLATTSPHACGSPTTYGGTPVASCTKPAAPGLGRPAARFGWGGMVMAGLLMLLPRKRLRWARALGALVVVLGMGVGLNGCGGHCTDLGTVPGAYTLTVTGTSVLPVIPVPPYTVQTESVTLPVGVLYP